MGVPSFYRWLVNKYPKIVVKVKCAAKEEDTSLPNPNGIEFDNLYLDLNGVIHPCFHPDTDDDSNMSLPTTYEDVFKNVFEYIDNIFSIVRPRKLLFLAIDGVAPRAKMNQQRSRRFGSSKDKKLSDEMEDRLRNEFEVQRKQVLPKVETQVSDSNVITPGTEFMYKLSQALKDYTCLRLKNDPGWRDIKVVLSDSNVPGEGEHKIMEYIRAQRILPEYDPNTRHCLYGLDADLIMLALATHEVHFSILREDVLLEKQQSKCASSSTSNLLGTQSSSDPCAVKSRGWFKELNVFNHTRSSSYSPFEFLHVWILREYLELDMMIGDLPKNVEFDLERVIDDFIFICFFAGNDFLPHMPTLEIHEGAIDLLMKVYKEEFNNLGGYLVDMQKVDLERACYIKLSRVEKFILKVGTYEEKIFRKRSEVHDSKLRNLMRDYGSNHVEETAAADDLATLSLESTPSAGSDSSNVIENTKELKEKVKKTIREETDLLKKSGPQIDKVRLSATGWKERYYKHKFSVNSREEIEALRKEIIFKYTEGLLWVLCYYFSGVPSWTWFYPYYYGPFASDMRGISQLKIKFQKGVPFKPFDQLMGVLPPMSASALPQVYRSFMTDEDSRIIDFYPTDFELDTDGKRFAWQGICKLPFINEERLLAETKQIEKDLTAEESRRNAENSPQLFGRTAGCNTQDDLLCVPYELPHDHHHLPRLLEGVILPDKTVFANDIMATDLWHEKQFRRPNTRMPHSEHERKAGHGFLGRGRGQRSQQHMPHSEHKQITGHGFLGRGRGQSQRSQQHTTQSEHERIAGHGFLGRGRGQSQRSQQQIGGNVNHSPWGHASSSSYDQNIKSATYQGTGKQQDQGKVVGTVEKNNNFWPSRNEHPNSNGEGYRSCW